MWICKTCNAEVEDSFDICWNCKRDKNGTLQTHEEIQTINQGFKDSIDMTDSKYFSEINTPVNKNIIGIKPEKIVAAGKSLKSIVSLILFNFFMGFALGFSYYFVDAEFFRTCLIIAGILSFITNLVMIIQLYNAGDHLEYAVEINEPNENK